MTITVTQSTSTGIKTATTSATCSLDHMQALDPTQAQVEALWLIAATVKVLREGMKHQGDAMNPSGRTSQPPTDRQDCADGRKWGTP